MTCVGACEVDDYARAVYARNFGHEPMFRDIRDVKPANIPTADVWCGGFPCKDVSKLGRRGDGIHGEQSGLWWAWFRLVRVVRPRIIFVENVPALFVRGFDEVVGSLAGIGYDAEWTTLSAASVGAPHIRSRIWLVAYSARGIGTGAGVLPDAGQPGLQRGGPGEPATNCTWWGSTPEVRGVAHGVPGRVDQKDRLRVLGNAVVPQVVEVVGARIKQVWGG